MPTMCCISLLPALLSCGEYGIGSAGVLILSEFTGASQSLGAGAILVNPWNITDLSAAIADALTMSEAERRERHRQNHMHITIHTSQTWAETFISELNDTHVEAELRTKHIPPQVSMLCCVALCCAVLCCGALLCAVLCYAVLCRTLGWHFAGPEQCMCGVCARP